MHMREHTHVYTHTSQKLQGYGRPTVIELQFTLLAEPVMLKITNSVPTSKMSSVSINKAKRRVFVKIWGIF